MAQLRLLAKLRPEATVCSASDPTGNTMCIHPVDSWLPGMLAELQGLGLRCSQEVKIPVASAHGSGCIDQGN